MNYSDLLWKKIDPIYQNIIKHPFNKQLADGSLDQEKFCFYIEQDEIYLRAFSKCLASIAAHCEDPEMIKSFLDFSHYALIVEQEIIHQPFLTQFNYQRKESISPACFAYTHYLLSQCTMYSLEIAVAAVLPCFWIYNEVGKHIFAHQNNDNNPYQIWINTYSSKGFDETVNKVISILNCLAKKANPKTLQEMEQAFIYSSLLEWHFWNDAYLIQTFKDLNQSNARFLESKKFELEKIQP